MKTPKKTEKNFIRDPKFVPAVPTHVLQHTHREVKIITKLYGEVTQTRLVNEMRACKHRAEQLAR